MNEPTHAPFEPTPEVLAKRAVIARWVMIGKRIGYGGLLLAIVAFVVAAITDFPQWAVTLATVGLVVGCVALPLPIVFGYGIKAAEHEERGGGAFH